MTGASPAPTQLEFSPLRNGHPLGLLHDACLTLRAPRYATCRACENVCPAKAIRVGESAIELDESCVRCGRCAAACPMGALAQPGFSIPGDSAEPSKPLSVDCWKVPRDDSPDGATRVPCLGGLSAARLVQLVASAGARRVELLDRGWCSRCSAAGSSDHPVRAALEQARSILKEAGSARLPELRSNALPTKLMPLEIPAPMTEVKMARRGFFSALAANAAVSIDRVKPLDPGREGRRRRGFEREPVPSRERERLLSALELLGKSTGVRPPRSLFPRIEISAACANHQLCASVCPTGALAVLEQGRATELMFDTRLCIGCHQCRSVCPSGALSLLPNGDATGREPLPNHPIRLTSFVERTCPECATEYTDKGVGEELCPQCSKRHNLAGSAFKSLFGAGR